MFFFLSKTLSYLTQPLFLICGLLVASFFFRNTRFKKIAFRTGVILLLIFSNDFLANEVMRWWEPDITPFASIQKRYEYGIVLTGVTKAQVGPNDRVYFQRGADRITHALQLYRLGIIKKILISGGTGRLIDIGWREADELASFLKLAQVPDSVIVLENVSSNTHDSAVEVSKMMEGKTRPEECLLITSGFHMRRSRACYKKVGWNMDTFPTDPMSHERLFHPDILLVPKLEALAIWHSLFKEWVGMTAYKMAGYI
jgi:uncharacterized SAM-binding protein YcdF (DUF218 family)